MKREDKRKPWELEQQKANRQYMKLWVRLWNEQAAKGQGLPPHPTPVVTPAAAVDAKDIERQEAHAAGAGTEDEHAQRIGCAEEEAKMTEVDEKALKLTHEVLDSAIDVQRNLKAGNLVAALDYAEAAADDVKQLVETIEKLVEGVSE